MNDPLRTPPPKPDSLLNAATDIGSLMAAVRKLDRHAKNEQTSAILGRAAYLLGMPESEICLLETAPSGTGFLARCHGNPEVEDALLELFPETTWSGALMGWLIQPLTTLSDSYQKALDCLAQHFRAVLELGTGNITLDQPPLPSYPPRRIRQLPMAGSFLAGDVAASYARLRPRYPAKGFALLSPAETPIGPHGADIVFSPFPDALTAPKTRYWSHHSVLVVRVSRNDGTVGVMAFYPDDPGRSAVFDYAPAQARLLIRAGTDAIRRHYSVPAITRTPSAMYVPKIGKTVSTTMQLLGSMTGVGSSLVKERCFVAIPSESFPALLDEVDDSIAFSVPMNRQTEEVICNAFEGLWPNAAGGPEGRRHAIFVSSTALENAKQKPNFLYPYFSAHLIIQEAARICCPAPPNKDSLSWWATFALLCHGMKLPLPDPQRHAPKDRNPALFAAICQAVSREEPLNLPIHTDALNLNVSMIIANAMHDQR